MSKSPQTDELSTPTADDPLPPDETSGASEVIMANVVIVVVAMLWMVCVMNGEVGGMNLVSDRSPGQLDTKEKWTTGHRNFRTIGHHTYDLTPAKNLIIGHKIRNKRK